jgi:hypothetical protein
MHFDAFSGPAMRLAPINPRALRAISPSGHPSGLTMRERGPRICVDPEPEHASARLPSPIHNHTPEHAAASEGPLSRMIAF